MSAPRPIRTFFSEVPDGADPFELLGLSAQPCDDDAVRAALDQRLARLAQHPQAHSPDADEVRLVLHVACAQLLDPLLRREILADRAARAQRTDASPVVRLPTASSIELAALHAIASSGGWNETARRRVAALLHAEQIPLATLPSIISAVGARVARERHDAASGARYGAIPALDARAARSLQQRHRARLFTKWVLLGAFVLSIGSIALLSMMLIDSYQRSVAYEQEGERRAEAEQVESGTAAMPQEESALTPVAEKASPAGTASKQAGERQRARSADGLIAPAPTELAATPIEIDPNSRAWLDAATVLLEKEPFASQTDEARLQRVGRLARLNQAAAYVWDAAADPRDLLISLDPAPSRIQAAASPVDDPATFTAPGVPPDGTLALELLEVRRGKQLDSQAFRGRRYGHLKLGPVDCDVAADSALFGSPHELRLIAARIVLDQSSNPAMIHALLEALPRAPKSDSTSELVMRVTEQSVPSIDDPSWRATCRRMLLERLAMLLGEVWSSELDALAGWIAQSYDAQARGYKPGMSSGSTVSTPAGTLPEAPAARLFDRWMREIGGLRSAPGDLEKITRIRQKREARLALARGPMQRFAAQQVSCAEALALLVAIETPSLAADVERVTSEALAIRARAMRVIEQMEIAEHTISRLWRIRLSREPERREQS